jgi:hypothetical protein
MPSFLKTVNSQPHWNEARAIFNRIQRGGYQECLPA